jgi:hypothetical protein
MTDCFDRDALIALDLDEETVDLLLSCTPHVGHDGRPAIPAEDLPDLLARLEMGGEPW